MKKNLLYLIIIITFIIVFSFSIYIGLINNKELNYTYSPKMGGLTYEFSGESKNFSFDVGKVFLSEKEKSILVDYFRQKNRIKNLKSLTITILLDGKEWQHISITGVSQKKRKRIDGVRFYEGGYVCNHNSQIECEKTDFSEIAVEENFKNIFSITATYCLKNNKCETEKFNIKYEY